MAAGWTQLVFVQPERLTRLWRIFDPHRMSDRFRDVRSYEISSQAENVLASRVRLKGMDFLILIDYNVKFWPHLMYYYKGLMSF